MNARKYFGLALVLILLVPATAAAAPELAFLTGPCAPGGAYDPACDVNHDGAVNVLDVQLAAGHWNQTGTFTSDNNHTHLGQTWIGASNPLKIQGAFGSPDYAPLVLSNSAGNGLRVTSAGSDGVYVVSADYDGVHVGSAGGDGVRVNSAGYTGVVVVSAGYDGVYVNSAGTDGVVVGSAGDDGVDVYSAGDDGVYVSSAGDDGVYVGSAGGDGVDATSTGASFYGGRLVNSAASGGGVYARGGGNAAADLILGGTTGGDDDGRLYSEPSLTGSDLLFFSNDHAHIHLDEDNNSASNFTIYSGTNTDLWSVDEAGMAVAAGSSAVQVDAGGEGKRLTYAVTSPQNWVEDFGSGQLQDGEAVIGLETVYAEAVSSDQSYRVFLTPLGDCALYVAEKTGATFTVRALGGEKCSVAFDYRIVALRRGYETVRMEQFVEVIDE